MIKDSWLARWWHACKGLFHSPLRNWTPAEAELRNRVDVLQANLADREQEITLLRLERDTLDSRLKISSVEIQCLTEIIVRDRKRIEAETAGYAAQIAAATLTSRPG